MTADPSEYISRPKERAAETVGHLNVACTQLLDDIENAEGNRVRAEDYSFGTIKTMLSRGLVVESGGWVRRTKTCQE